ncbi:hypothetical protein Tco_0496709 [Tanacetum coccineum]
MVFIQSISLSINESNENMIIEPNYYADDDRDQLLSFRMAGNCWKMTWSDVPVVPSDGRKKGCQMRLNSTPIYRQNGLYGVTKWKKCFMANLFSNIVSYDLSRQKVDDWEFKKKTNKDRDDKLDNVKTDGEQSHDEVYGCLKCGSGNSRGRRLAISMVEEAWLSEKEEVSSKDKECFRRREIMFSSKKKMFSLERKDVFVEEKECFRLREKNVFVEEKECFFEEKECFVEEENVFVQKKCFRRRERMYSRRERMLSSKRKGCFCQREKESVLTYVVKRLE